MPAPSILTSVGGPSVERPRPLLHRGSLPHAVELTVAVANQVEERDEAGHVTTQLVATQMRDGNDWILRENKGNGMDGLVRLMARQHHLRLEGKN